MSNIKLEQESNYNEPAFPQSNPDVAYSDYIGGGMTLRDYFAGQALAKLVTKKVKHYDPIESSREAYEYADAMLITRKVKRFSDGMVEKDVLKASKVKP